MPDVTRMIRDTIRAKDRAVIGGTKAILVILRDLQQQVVAELGQAALGSWDAYHLRQMEGSLETQISAFEKRAQQEMDGRLTQAWDLGRALVDEPLISSGLGGVWSGYHLSTTVLEALKDFTFGKISGVSAAAFDRIKAELTLGILGGKTPQDVARAIGMNLNDPSVFRSIAQRAETITKLEMGRVFSEASQARMEQTAGHVPGLEKQWYHAGHPVHARPSHLAAHGQLVPVDQPFLVGDVEMMFPRDPGAPLEETINCG